MKKLCSNTKVGYRKSQLEGLAGTFPELLTAKDLETLLKIDVKTIYKYVQRGLIPYVRIQSNVRFYKRDILEWLETQTYRPRSA